MNRVELAAAGVPVTGAAISPLELSTASEPTLSTWQVGLVGVAATATLAGLVGAGYGAYKAIQHFQHGYTEDHGAGASLSGSASGLELSGDSLVALRAGTGM